MARLLIASLAQQFISHGIALPLPPTYKQIQHLRFDETDVLYPNILDTDSHAKITDAGTVSAASMANAEEVKSEEVSEIWERWRQRLLIKKRMLSHGPTASEEEQHRKKLKVQAPEGETQAQAETEAKAEADAVMDLTAVEEKDQTVNEGGSSSGDGDESLKDAESSSITIVEPTVTISSISSNVISSRSNSTSGPLPPLERPSPERRPPQRSSPQATPHPPLVSTIPLSSTTHGITEFPAEQRSIPAISNPTLPQLNGVTHSSAMFLPSLPVMPQVILPTWPAAQFYHIPHLQSNGALIPRAQNYPFSQSLPSSSPPHSVTPIKIHSQSPSSSPPRSILHADSSASDSASPFLLSSSSFSFPPTSVPSTSSPARDESRPSSPASKSVTETSVPPTTGSTLDKFLVKPVQRPRRSQHYRD